MIDEPDVDYEPVSPDIKSEESIQLVKLPTDKEHVSFSEIRDWHDCSYRHKLKQVKKIDLSKPGPLADFGTAVHAAAEHFLRTRNMDVTIAHTKLHELWEANHAFKGYEPANLPNYMTQAAAILTELPQWLEETFPGWEFVDAEHFLYETLPNHPHAFKGYIDAIITAPGPKDKKLTWLIDWKTTSWGWSLEKKSNPMIKNQLIFYKNFWCKKTMTNLNDVRCAFVLLKRTAPEGKRCELLQVSVGDVTTSRALKVLNNMIVSVKRGIALKNRSSCQYCDYKDTEHCT